jgi:hypothetical protein
LSDDLGKIEGKSGYRPSERPSVHIADFKLGIHHWVLMNCCEDAFEQTRTLASKSHFPLVLNGSTRQFLAIFMSLHFVTPWQKDLIGMHSREMK